MRGRTAAALTTALAGGALALYLAVGSPSIGAAGGGVSVAAGQDAANRAADAATRVQRPDLVASVASLTQKLASGAGGVDEWRRLARTQAGLGRWQDSSESYRRLVALTGASVDDAADYGEALVLAAKGVVTPPGRTVFSGVLKRDPTNMSARYYLGLADAQAGNPTAAVERWRKLEADAPSNSRWLTTLRRQIAAAAAMAGIDMPPATPSQMWSSSAAVSSGSPSSPAQPASRPDVDSTAASGSAPATTIGPTSADVEAAQTLPDEQQSAMIRSMVERLAVRLETTPDDFDGWQRLARSYGVLGEKKQAAAAAERAAALRPSSATLLEAAQAVFVAEGTEDPRVTLPPSFVALLQRVLSLDPDEPDALWYLGLAQAQEHNPKAASAYWRRLAAALPKDSERRKTVNAALAAIE
jgi:cytochrome c-type biogenesis protein CcmH